jgi:hypothetical protein
MRYRLMATYQDVPYEAGIGPSDGDVVLFAACPPPEELGFEPATGHWRKQLRVQDVQALWESRPMGRYRGQPCMVLDDLGERLHIAYLGHDAYQAQQLGYWQVDRGVFELVTPRDEVTEVTEERSDYAGKPAGRPDDLLSVADYDPATTDFGPATDYGPATTDFGPTTDYGPATTDYRPAGADYGPATTDFGGGTPSGLAPAPVPPDFGALSRPGEVSSSRPPDFGAAPSPGRGISMPPGQPIFPPPPGLGDGMSPSQPPPVLPPGFTIVPPTSEPPLPLEAAALRAASAAALPKQGRLAAQASQAAQEARTLLADRARAGRDLSAMKGAVATQAPPAPHAALVTEALPSAAVPPAAQGLLTATAAPTALELPVPTAMSPAPRRRRSARSRLATQGIFIELASLAAIPAAAYAVGEEVDGALCLIETATGYEVFSAAGGARHEVRTFDDEESAYFYLFGVLAAEAVRTGLLIPHR